MANNTQKPYSEIDWIDLELDFRLGEKTEEELIIEYGIVNVETLQKVAADRGWYEGIQTDAIHPKYVRFVEAYMQNWDQKEALAAAGLKGNADAIMRRPEVRELLHRRLQESSIRAQITHDKLLQLWWSWVNIDPRKLYDEEGKLKHVTEMDDETVRAIAQLEIVDDLGFESENGKSRDPSRTTKLKFISREAVARDIAKHIGMFVDRTEVTGKNGGPIVTKETTPNDVARRVAFLLLNAAKKGQTA